MRRARVRRAGPSASGRNARGAWSRTTGFRPLTTRETGGTASGRPRASRPPAAGFPDGERAGTLGSRAAHPRIQPAHATRRTGGGAPARPGPPDRRLPGPRGRVGADVPRMADAPWHSARSPQGHPRAGGNGRSAREGPWHSARSRLQSGREPRGQLAPALPTASCRVPFGERARTRRVLADAPWHSARSPQGGGERARTRGAPATHPGIPPAHGQCGREARDQPAPRLPARRRRAGENAWSAGHAPWPSARSR